MHRLLRALPSAGALEEQSDSRFSLTDIGECLRSDSLHSRVEWARVIGRPHIWQSWGDLRHSVTTGEPAFEHLHGVSLWEWRAERPEEARISGTAQSELSRGNFDAIVGVFDFSRFGASLMMAAGRGSLWAVCWPGTLEARVSLHDLPEVVTGAPAVLRTHGVDDRCQAVGGDMFSSVPGRWRKFIVIRAVGS
jgi:hypothetical protein